MFRNSVVIPIVLTLSFAVYTATETTESTDSSEIRSNAVRRCFQFTWLGHRYNNESVFLNATCMDATRLSAGVPCVHPLVVSYDGSWPDVDYIWQNYPDASCILADNDVCAKYTFSFDGVVENSTYFCTRAVNDMDQAIRSGCHEQVNGSHSTRVCFCTSIPGARPCNKGIIHSINYVTVSLIAIAIILQQFTNKTQNI